MRAYVIGALVIKIKIVAYLNERLAERKSVISRRFAQLFSHTNFLLLLRTYFPVPYPLSQRCNLKNKKQKSITAVEHFKTFLSIIIWRRREMACGLGSGCGGGGGR